MKRILITCIGGRYSYLVVDSIRRAKKLSKFILGVDVNPNVNAFFVDKFEAVPRADLSKSKYIKKIIYLCKKYKIDIVIPLSENETLAISKHINFFEKHKIKTSVSSFETVNLMTDKLKMFEHLNSSRVDVGKWRKIDNFNDAVNALNFFEYPSKKVVIKPRFSSGSRAVLIINRKKNSFVKLLSDRFCGEGSWEVIKEELKNRKSSEEQNWFLNLSSYTFLYADLGVEPPRGVHLWHHYGNTMFDKDYAILKELIKRESFEYILVAPSWGDFFVAEIPGESNFIDGVSFKEFIISDGYQAIF